MRTARGRGTNRSGAGPAADGPSGRRPPRRSRPGTGWGRGGAASAPRSLPLARAGATRERDRVRDPRVARSASYSTRTTGRRARAAAPMRIEHRRRGGDEVEAVGGEHAVERPGRQAPREVGDRGLDAAAGNRAAHRSERIGSSARAVAVDGDDRRRPTPRTSASARVNAPSPAPSSSHRGPAPVHAVADQRNVIAMVHERPGASTVATSG